MQFLGFPEVEDPCSKAEGRKSWILPQRGQETEEGLFIYYPVLSSCPQSEAFL